MPIEFNEFIQPVNLTTDCAIPHLGKQEVILSGRGLPELDESNIEFDSRLRHAFFVTASHSFCRNMVTPMKDPNSVICAMENIQGQRGFCGDSGMIFFSRFYSKVYRIENIDIFGVCDISIRWPIGISC